MLSSKSPLQILEESSESLNSFEKKEKMLSEQSKAPQQLKNLYSKMRSNTGMFTSRKDPTKEFNKMKQAETSSPLKAIKKLYDI